MIPQHSNAALSNSRPTTPVVLPSSSRDLILPPSVKDFSLPLKPFRIPFLHTKDARIAVVNENEKLKRPSTASSFGRTESSLALGIRTQVTESRNANALSGQGSHGFPSRPSTALSSSSLTSTMRPKSVGTSRNRSLTDHELDRIDAEKRRLDDRLISMKEILNDMNAQSKFMDEELKRLQFKSTILDKDLLDCDVDAEHRLVQSLHAIQTKTEYWIQSLKEEELYTNTLALVFERNSSKRVDVESKYSAAQSELVHYDHDLHVLSIRLHQAKLEQAAAEKACNSFAEEISNWRKQRDSQMASRSKQVSDMRLESLSVAQQVEGTPGHSNLLTSEVESVNSVSESLSKRSLQDGMLQMKRLTQQESALSIAASYNSCIERTQMFLEEEEATKQRIAECKSQKEMLFQKLQMLKYGGDDSDANADQMIKGRTAKLEKYFTHFMFDCFVIISSMPSEKVLNATYSYQMRRCNLPVLKLDYKICKTGCNSLQPSIRQSCWIKKFKLQKYWHRSGTYHV